MARVLSFLVTGGVEIQHAGRVHATAVRMNVRASMADVINWTRDCKELWHHLLYCSTIKHLDMLPWMLMANRE